MASPRTRRIRPGGVFRAVGRLVLMVAAGFAAGLVVGVALEEPALLAGHLRGEGETVRLVDAPYADSGGEVALDLGEGEPAGVAGAQAEQRDGEPGRVAAAESGVDPSGSRTNDDASEETHAQARRLELARAESAPRENSALPSVAASQGVRAGSETVAPQRGPAVVAQPPAAREPSGGNLEARDAAAIDSQRWAIQVGAFADEAAARALVADLDADDFPAHIVPRSSGKSRYRVRVQPIRGKARATALANRLKREKGLPTWLLPMESGGR